MADYSLTEFFSAPLNDNYLVCPKCLNAVPFEVIDEEFVCDLCDTPLDEKDRNVK